MNRLEHLARLLSYEDWANRELLAVLQGAPEPAALKSFAHVLAAQTLWMDRMAHRPMSVKPWPEWDLAECTRRVESVRAGWQNFLRGLDAAALDVTISYVTTKGDYYQSQVGDIISHLLFHGAHHRGQACSALREAGQEPPTMDFIFAVRTGVLGPSQD